MALKAPSSLRLRSVDALRGAAAIGVVLYHAVQQGPAALPNNLLKFPAQGIQLLTSFGYIGVFLFFVISGFCIHLQWARARANGEQIKIKFGAFWKKRLRRLYPPYVIALILFLGIGAYTSGIDVTHFLFYDVVMHLLLIHNLDPKTCYTINGVFWTLAIEEQLYLIYFLLLFLRIRFGWTTTLTICLLARVGWMAFSHLVWLKAGIGVPVPEAAAVHWFTWALGALAVEAYFGLIKLPRWTGNLWLATILIVTASVLSEALWSIPKDTIPHYTAWFLIHPFWGLGFFIVVNRAVLAETSWKKQLRLPTLVSIFSTLGIFSYSIYLVHELVIMQSWQWINPSHPQLVNVLFVIIPATLFFSWTFFWFCEKPFMSKRSDKPANLAVPSDEFPVSN